jgi:hypothetical protein
MLEIPKKPGPRSTPGGRLFVGIIAEVLRCGAVIALIDGWRGFGVLAMIVARGLEWKVGEDQRW